MRAVSWAKYGKPDVLQVMECAKPAPKKNEILIKVHVGTITAGDARLRSLDVPPGFKLLTRLAFGLFKPRSPIPGIEFSGEVAALGADVKQYAVGDQVFGTTGMRLGAHAEYVCLPESAAIVNKSAELSHTEAAAVLFGGQTAIHFLRDQANLQSGQRVLINGASGAVGTIAVQLAKYLGAEVTGVCSSANTELVQSLGADHVVAYDHKNILQSGDMYDVILDAVGNLPLASCQHLLKPSGKLISINAGLLTSLRSLMNKQLICGVADETKENLTFLASLAAVGDIKPVIDKIYTLEQIAEAHAYVDTGRKRGAVVLSIAD